MPLGRRRIFARSRVGSAKFPRVRTRSSTSGVRDDSEPARSRSQRAGPHSTERNNIGAEGPDEHGWGTQSGTSLRVSACGSSALQHRVGNESFEVGPGRAGRRDTPARPHEVREAMPQCRAESRATVASRRDPEGRPHRGPSSCGGVVAMCAGSRCVRAERDARRAVLGEERAETRRFERRRTFADQQPHQPARRRSSPPRTYTPRGPRDAAPRRRSCFP